jgi:hypothetical protein
MPFEDHIIQVALLGTDKQQINIAEADEFLQPSLQIVAGNTSLDKEEAFLQSVALAFNYRQAGAVAPVKMEASIESAPAEEKLYCSPASLHALKDILDIESVSLLRLWLQSCADNHLLVTPDFIPVLFDIAAGNKRLLPLVTKCCGKRGEWLITFNENWKFSGSDNLDEIWQTGSLEQRKLALEQVRVDDVAKALQMLSETWATEDANTKAVFLGVLETNIGDADRDFIEQARAEKSKKVKEVATNLLKLIPSSTIVQQYVNVLQLSLQIKKDKALLGLLSKKALQIELGEIDESVFATGIEKLSNIKDVDDSIYIVCQLIKNIPPVALKELLQIEYDEMANLFLQKKSHLLSALTEGAIKFKDVACLQIALHKDKGNFYRQAIPLLPPAEANAYCQNYFEQQKGNQAFGSRSEIIDMVCKSGILIGSSFCAVMCQQLASDTYQFNRRFYNNYIHLFPADFPSVAEKYVPQQEYYQNQWSSIVSYVKRLMYLRSSTIKHFSTQNN